MFRYTASRPFLLRPKHPLSFHLHTSRPPSSSANADLDSLSSSIAALVLSQPDGATPRSLLRSLTPSYSSPSTFSTSLVDRVLKLLWNDAPKALLFFHSLLILRPSFIPAASSLDLALDIAARLRDRGQISKLLSIRQNRRLPPPTPRTFAVLIERYINGGKADRAIRVFLSMHRQGCRQDLSSFNTLLDLLCKSGRVEKACSLLKIFRRRFSPDTITYNIVADGWCRIKQTPRAIATLKEMVESGLDPTITTYNILLKGFFRAGQVKEALEFFRQMKRRCREEGSACGPDVVSYTTVVHGLGIVGQVEKARKMFDEMVKRGCHPSVATYNALIQVLCKKESVHKAILVFEEMKNKGCAPNSVTYNLVIKGLCHAGDMNGAVQFMERMRREECNPNVQTYNILIRYRTEAGEIEKGLDLLKEMVGSGNCLPDMDTYNVLISSMFARKKQEDMLMAGNLVLEMVKRGYLPTRFMFNRVLNGLLLTGSQEFAREIMRVQSSCHRLRREIKL